MKDAIEKMLDAMDERCKADGFELAVEKMGDGSMLILIQDAGASFLTIGKVYYSVNRSNTVNTFQHFTELMNSL